MRKNLIANKTLLKYVMNSSWMFMESIVKISASFLVAIFIARYLGPKHFGILTYVISIVYLFMALSRLGMENILVRELVRHPDKRHEYMGTAFLLMLYGSILSIGIVALFGYFYEQDPQINLYLLLVAASLLLQPFFVIDYNFQSKVKAKYSSIAKSLATLLGALVKIYLVLVKADLIYFVIAYLIDYLLISLFLYGMHLNQREPSFFFHFQKKIVKPLLKSAMPLVFASLTMSLYITADKLLIKHFLGLDELGVYSAASKLYEGLLFFPIVVGTSLLPALVKLKQTSFKSYHRNLTRIFSLIIWTHIPIALVSLFYSQEIILLTFGNAYIHASTSMAVLMWASIFIGVGTINYTYFSVEKMENKLILRTLTALLVNLSLDIILIPLYGIEGAAIATLVSVVTAYYLLDALDTQTRMLLKVKTKAFFLQIT